MTTLRNPYETVLYLAILLTATLAPGALAQQAPEALRGVFAPSADNWKIPADAKGTPLLEVSQVDGRSVVTASQRLQRLTAETLPETPFELIAQVRQVGEGQGNRVITMTVGPLDPETRKYPVNASMTIQPQHARAGGALYVGEQERALLHFDVDGIGGRSLNWPEDFRRIIEHTQAQLIPTSERWFEARLQVRDQSVRMYVEDRIVGERPLDRATLAGPLVFGLGPDLAMAKLEIRPLSQPQNGYETLPLSGYYNTQNIAGTKLADGALTSSSGQPVVVDNVPFQVDQPDARGRDHIDLGTSWVPTGRLSGHFQTRGRGLSARWQGSWGDDGMRTQISIPSGRYKAVHLLAAADGDKNELPVVTAQFYRNQRGFPQNFTFEGVPSLTDTKATGVKVKLVNGKEAQLYKITIPVDPGKLAAFEGRDDLELELTKHVELYRAYPDPFYYTYHGAGLPSSVHVFAVTLERPAVEMTLTPGAFADAWAAPDTPSYDVTLRNTTDKPKQVQLKVHTTSYFEKQKTNQTKDVNIPAGGEQTVKFDIKPPSHGYHDLVVELHDGTDVWREARGLAYLHEDTRERGGWEPGMGPIFGFWNWRGGHETPSGAEQTGYMGLAGAESASGSFEEAGKRVTDEEREMARKWGMITFKAFGAGDHYTTADFAKNLKADGLAKAKTAFLERMEKTKTAASDVNRPELMSFFPEPHIGATSYGTPPQYYGDPPREMSEHDEERFQYFLKGFVEGAKILKEHYPNVKPMLPHGDPLFAIPFVQRSEEARELFQGIAVDIPVFERLPEQQIHQVSIHRMYFARDGLSQVGIDNPTLAMYEGPSRSAYYGALSDQQLADFSIRDALLLIGYGVDRQMGGFAPFESASYWGEQHYGGGLSHRLPRGTPRPAYAAFGTMTRHLNRRNYTKWIPTGSLSVYNMQFAHHKTGETMHAMWTIRGQRPITVEMKNPGDVVVYDLMDNKDPVTVEGNKVTFTLSSSPVWVYGLSGDEKITLGEPDHSDAAPADDAVKVASLGDGSWKQSTERDEDYENSHADFVKRFPGDMSVASAEAPAQAGNKALAVQLASKQSRDQNIMPYYTTLVPAKPVAIPGKASHLGLWVKANSDWGRVIYSLRDARGEKWLSVGTAGAWNCDDILNHSVFNFDGWRYLTFEMPSSSGWDNFREAGTVWWGSYGQGDQIVDLPLSLEKVIVERRTGAMYVTDPQPADVSDVLLADMYAEYDSALDATDEAVRRSQVRMTVPENVPDLDNPIAQLAKAGVHEPVKVTKIELPTQQADGTRCSVFFTESDKAELYEVWVSPYEDGRGAMMLGKDWTEPGKEIRGLRPDTPFYIFVVYRDAEKQASKPSQPHEIVLKDMFGMK